MTTRPPVDIRTLGALLLEWCVILATITATVRLAHWALWLPAILVVATRQHALLMLFHDAVHGLLARDRRLNDFLIKGLIRKEVLPFPGCRFDSTRRQLTAPHGKFRIGAGMNVKVRVVRVDRAQGFIDFALVE